MTSNNTVTTTFTHPKCIEKDACSAPLLAMTTSAKGEKNLRVVGVAPLQKIYIDDLTERRRHQWRVPWFILLMCFVQMSLHLIANGCLQRRLIFIPDLQHEYWRFFTYMLLHSDNLHLGLNICLQCVIGLSLEMEQGHCRLACVYIMGGICGSMATAWLQPQLSLLGASAGVYAMLLSHIPHLVKNISQLPHRYVRIVALLILCFSDICFTTFHLLVNHNVNPRICLEAHLAGGVAGFLCGFIVYRRLSRPPWGSNNNNTASCI